MRETEHQWDESAQAVDDESRLRNGRAAEVVRTPVPASLKSLGIGRVPLFIGASQAVRSLWRDIRAFAATPYPVLLVGPTGVGKTVLAREIHAHSERARAPFLHFPLTSVPEDLRHAELSGSSRGSYTGATHDRPGAMEAAHGGTLFLDELNHASLGLQQALLTLLESKGVQRIGETHARPVDVRFVLASSTELEELVHKGRFLEELLYRVEGLAIRVPDLSERRADIVPLAHHFVDEALAELHRPFLYEFADELQQFLLEYPWPGNIRELRSISRFLAVRLDEERSLNRMDLPRNIPRYACRADTGSIHKSVLTALDRAGGNKAKAARALGISRTKFYKVFREKLQSSP